MEADHRHTATGFENPKSCLQSCFDLAQLVVDRDADALEGPGRDVDVARPRPSGDGRLHGCGQIARGAQRAARHYELCDPPRPPLFAIVAQGPLELCDVKLVDDPRGGERGAGVHPHVQRPVGAKAEAALSGVELDAGETEVEKDQVGRDEPGPASHGVQLAEATMDDDHRRPVFRPASPSGSPPRSMPIRFPPGAAAPCSALYGPGRPARTPPTSDKASAPAPAGRVPEVAFAAPPPARPTDPADKSPGRCPGSPTRSSLPAAASGTRLGWRAFPCRPRGPDVLP